MSEDTRYGVAKGLFMALCWVTIIGAGIHSCASLVGNNMGAAAPPIASPPTYQLRFCDVRKTIDYSDENPEQITIPLTDGCYGDHIILPKAWITFQPQKTTAIGDYASVWCSEEANPRRIVPYTTLDMAGTLTDCPRGRPSADFSLEGRGTLTLIRTRTNEQAAALARRQVAEDSYKNTTTEPTSGDHEGYSITVQQCYRIDDQIDCWGMATNLTDAPAPLGFYGGNSVDDEGNTFSYKRLFFPGAGDGYFTGAREILMPGVPTKFSIEIPDAHHNVKTINLQINTSIEFDNRSHRGQLVFPDIPVQ